MSEHKRGILVAVSVAVLGVLALALVANYLGSDLAATSTSTSTSSSGGGLPNPAYPSATSSTCIESQSRCMINVTENSYNGLIGGFGEVQWSCQKNVPPGGQSCQGAMLDCKSTNITSGGTATISCTAQPANSFPTGGIEYMGTLYLGEGPSSSYQVTFVGNFTN
jgi:hypothetical protein